MDQNRQILDELDDRLEQIFSDIEKLREGAGDGKSSRQFLDSIFRNVHSLKASASANGLTDLASISHQFENLLHSLRVGQLSINDEVLRAFEKISDAMYSSLSEPASVSSLEVLFEGLKTLTQQNPRGSRLEVDLILNAIPPDIWRGLSEEERHRLKQAISEGANLFLVKTSFGITNFDQHFQTLKEQLLSQGEVIATAPTVTSDQPDKIDFRILYSSETEQENIEAELRKLADVTLSQVHPQREPGVKRSGSLLTAPAKAELIRVDLHDLDRLISTTQELIRDTKDCFSREQPEDSLLRSKHELVEASLMKLASDLVNLRMVSLDRLLQRVLRAGKSAAYAAGKDIAFFVEGTEIKIDKTLSDGIADPLIHLVRNAVDHGIEEVELRKTLGKPQRGTIAIEATSVQGRTLIRVSDDGRGIDPKLISDRGRQLGLVSEAKQFDIAQSVRLIFRSGFSTAESVSEISGRGVGLDVVESAIEEVGGAIRVKSQPGLGSTFEIVLPVTFSLLDVLVVREKGVRYLLDARQVLASGSVEAIISPGIPLVTLSELLGQDPGPTNTGSVLSCKLEYNHGGPSIGLLVSEVISTEQVLIRNLGSRGGRWLGVAGAAEMGDGGVALLLDLPSLMAASEISSFVTKDT